MMNIPETSGVYANSLFNSNKLPVIVRLTLELLSQCLPSALGVCPRDPQRFIICGAASVFLKKCYALCLACLTKESELICFLDNYFGTFYLLSAWSLQLANRMRVSWKLSQSILYFTSTSFTRGAGALVCEVESSLISVQPFVLSLLWYKYVVTHGELQYILWFLTVSSMRWEKSTDSKDSLLICLSDQLNNTEKLLIICSP